MNETDYVAQILGRFRPASSAHFSTYAKHLSRLTGDSLGGSLHTLARIYRYDSLYELHQVLKEDGVPGPFDDEIPISVLENEEIRSAFEDRIVRAMDLILDASSERFLSGAPSPTLLQLSTLELFARIATHLEGFRELALPKTTSAERKAERAKFTGGRVLE